MSVGIDLGQRFKNERAEPRMIGSIVALIHRTKRGDLMLEHDPYRASVARTRTRSRGSNQEHDQKKSRVILDACHL